MPTKIQYKSGDIIGNNEIIEEDVEQTQKKGRTFWICKCINCGNIRSLRVDNLKRNKKCQKCHNTNGENIKDNLIGQTFGVLTVVGKSKKTNYWICYCHNCGSYKEIFRGNLIQGVTKSCGCVHSWKEREITNLLNYYNINYKKEFIFKDLKTPKNGFPRFDFAIFNKYNQLYCVIEYDGKQHFIYDKNWKMTYEDFKYLQSIDKLKNDYCQKNNIKLLRFNSNTDIEKEILVIQQELLEVINE